MKKGDRVVLRRTSRQKAASAGRRLPRHSGGVVVTEHPVRFMMLWDGEDTAEWEWVANVELESVIDTLARLGE